VIILGLASVKIFKIDFGTVSGMLCGSMANPMALDYANSILPGDRASVAYATVYPLCMFARVILVQIVILCFC
ncbi:MAG: transporter, partial [Muribaculaceae bacterium]|nr:transporter [Muribaculaceae bacterium]